MSRLSGCRAKVRTVHRVAGKVMLSGFFPDRGIRLFITLGPLKLLRSLCDEPGDETSAVVNQSQINGGPNSVEAQR